MAYYCRTIRQSNARFCKRPARYVLSKTLWNEDAGSMDWELCQVSTPLAMFCKQHGQQECARHNAMLREARTEKVQAAKQEE
jgi:hypothetical protein